MPGLQLARQLGVRPEGGSVGALEQLELSPAPERDVSPAIERPLRGRAGDRLVRLATRTSRVLAEGARLFAPLREARVEEPDPARP